MQQFPPSSPATTKTQVLGLDSNIAGLLCYLPICAINLIASILFTATEPKSNRFVRFHAMQGLALAGFVIVGIIAIVVIGTILSLVLANVSGTLAAIVGLITMLLYIVLFLGFIILSIMGMVKAYKGELWKMPVIGNLIEGRV